MCAYVYIGSQWSHMKFHAAISTIRSTFHRKQMLVTKAEGMRGPPLCWECVTQQIPRFGMKCKRPRVPECSAGRGSNWSHVVFFLASEAGTCGIMKEFSFLQPVEFMHSAAMGKRLPVNKQTSFPSLQTSHTSHKKVFMCFAKLPSSCRFHLTFHKLWLWME